VQCIQWPRHPPSNRDDSASLTCSTASEAAYTRIRVAMAISPVSRDMWGVGRRSPEAQSRWKVQLLGQWPTRTGPHWPGTDQAVDEWCILRLCACTRANDTLRLQRQTVRLTARTYIVSRTFHNKTQVSRWRNFKVYISETTADRVTLPLLLVYVKWLTFLYRLFALHPAKQHNVIIHTLLTCSTHKFTWH